jgi:ADP-ribose pyrophosphatase YjhB (NUDIX family)
MNCARAIVIRHQNILLVKRNKFGDEYYTLPGGYIEPDETAEAAAVRELQEEASIIIDNLRLVFIDQQAKPYGTQYVFTAEYGDGDMHLRPDSDEALLNAGGQDTYQPLWVPINKLARLRFVSPELKQALLAGLRDGFPQEPKILSVQP